MYLWSLKTFTYFICAGVDGDGGDFVRVVCFEYDGRTGRRSGGRVRWNSERFYVTQSAFS